MGVRWMTKIDIQRGSTNGDTLIVLRLKNPIRDGIPILQFWNRIVNIFNDLQYIEQP